MSPPPPPSPSWHAQAIAKYLKRPSELDGVSNMQAYKLALRDGFGAAGMGKGLSAKESKILKVRLRACVRVCSCVLGHRAGQG